MRNFLMSTAAAVAASGFLAGSALAQEGVVHELTVHTDYSKLSDSNAQNYYPTISDDLLAAIADQIPMTNDPQGYVVTVNIQNMSLDGDTMLPDSKEFNTLEGVVTVTSPETTSGPESYPVRIRALSNDGAIPEGYVAVEPSQSDFYRAMVQSYANQVVEVLPEDIKKSVSK